MKSWSIIQKFILFITTILNIQICSTKKINATPLPKPTSTNKSTQKETNNTITFESNATIYRLSSMFLFIISNSPTIELPQKRTQDFGSGGGRPKGT